MEKNDGAAESMDAIANACKHGDWLAINTLRDALNVLRVSALAPWSPDMRAPHSRRSICKTTFMVNVCMKVRTQQCLPPESATTLGGEIETDATNTFFLQRGLKPAPWSGRSSCGPAGWDGVAARGR